MWPIALFMLNLVQCRHHWARENSDETSPTPNSCFCRPRRRAGTSTCRAGIESVKIDWPWVREESPTPRRPTRTTSVLGKRVGTYSARLHVVPVQCDGDLRLRVSTPRRLLSGRDWTGLGAEETTPSSSGLWALAGCPPPGHSKSPTSFARPFACPTRYRRLADPGPSRKKRKKSRGAWEHGSMALDHNTLHRRICASRARPHTA